MVFPLASLGSPVVFARTLQTAHEAGMDVSPLREVREPPDVGCESLS